MGTVTIGGNVYDIYGEHTGATTPKSATVYLLTNPNAVAWRALSADDQEATLVEAYNLFNRQRWSGAKTGGAAQEAAWPRTGVTYESGEAVPDDEIPLEVVYGSYEMAAYIAANGAQATSASNASSNIAEVGAGSARVKFFRYTTGGRFPTQVQELIAQFMGTGSGICLGFASGTDVEGWTADDLFERM